MPKGFLVEAGITAVCSQIGLMLPADSISWGVEPISEPQLCFINERIKHRSDRRKSAQILWTSSSTHEMHRCFKVKYSVLDTRFLSVCTLSEQVEPDLGSYLLILYSASSVQ